MKHANCKMKKGTWGWILPFALCILHFSFPLCAKSAPSIAWQRGPDMPSAHDYLGCGVMDGLFVVAGGAYWEHDQKHYGRGTIAYSPIQGRWITLPDLPKSGAYGASAVIDGQLVIAGGADSTGALKSCFRLRRVDGRLRWDSLPDLPRPIWGASGAALGKRFYVVGGAPGMDPQALKGAHPSLLMLDLSAVRPEWVEFVGPTLPAGRVGAASAVVGTKLFVFGGYGLQADRALGNFADAHMTDLGENPRTWMRIKAMPLTMRWSSARAIDDRYVMIAGGYAESQSSGFLDKVWFYDTTDDQYLPCDPLPLPVATMASCVGGDGTIYLAGGEDALRRRSSAFFVGRLGDR